MLLSTIDDSDDDGAVISAALQRGGTVRLPPGVFILSSTLKIQTPGVHLQGSGIGATILYAAPSFRDGDMILLDNTQYCSISDLTISGGPSLRTSGAAIRCQGLDGVSGANQQPASHWIHDLHLKNQFQGVLVDGQAWQHYIERVWIENLAPGGNGVTVAVTGLTGASQYLTNVYVNGGATLYADQPESAIRVRSTGDITLLGCQDILCRNGLVCDPNTTPGFPPVTALLMTNCLFDSNNGAGIRIVPATNVEVAFVQITNCWTGGNHGGGGILGSGIEIDGSASGAIVQEFQIIGHRATGNASNGIYIHGAGAKRFSIIGAGCASNAADGAGIAIADCGQFSVTGCYAGDGHYGATQKYGIRILTGCDNFVVTGNTCLGNATTNLLNESGTSATKIVANNVAP